MSGQPFRRPCGLALLLALACVPAADGQTVDVTAATIEDLNRAFDAGTLTSEQLVERYLARIAAYDDAGPALNAVIALNPNAVARARELDAERRSDGARSPLHGIPVVLKDNFDTADLPTTAGSVLLEGSLPPDDGFLVGKLREAGAIVLAKVNMSEFASGGAMSSLGGRTRNPHDLVRSPGGSSGGTGAAIAAAFAQVGLGTDTGGSVRSPSTANGIAGLKPTLGLLSRDGIVPLALSFDTAGPMARHVYDVAAALGVMTGVDSADGATAESRGRFETDYTQYLDPGVLAGARIGVARDFLGQDGDVDWVVEASLDVMREAGATIVDVRLPRWLLEASGDFYTVVRYREFRAQIAEYLATLDPRFHASLADLVKRSVRLTAPAEGAGHNPGRWRLMRQEDASGELSDAEYRAVLEHGLPMVRAVIHGLMDARRPRGHRVPDLAPAARAHRRRPGAHRRGRPLGDAVREPQRLPRSHRARRVHRRRAPRGPLLPGSRVRRTPPPGPRLRLRAGDPGAPSPGTHAAAWPVSRRAVHQARLGSAGRTL